MGAKRQAKKELAKEQELAKLRAAEARKKAAKESQRKAAAARAAAHQERLAAMSPGEKAEYKKQQGRLGIAAVMVLALVVGGCIYVGATGDDEDGDTTSGSVDDASGQQGGAAPVVDQDDQEFAAFDICTEFVKDRLKSPSSASFRNYFEDDGGVLVTGSGLGPYTVTSTVDSENSFGAELRIPFVCKVSNPDGDDRWVLNDLQLME